MSWGMAKSTGEGLLGLGACPESMRHGGQSPDYTRWPLTSAPDAAGMENTDNRAGPCYHYLLG